MRVSMCRLLVYRLQLRRTAAGLVTGSGWLGCYDAAVPRRRALSRSSILLAALVLAVARPSPAQVPTPEQHFGFRMGADGRLAGADQIEKYFEAVAAKSDRVKILDVGQTTEGHRTIAA